MREIEEETGIRGEIVDAITQVMYTTTKAGRMRCKVVTYFLIRAQTEQPRPSRKENIVEARWVPSGQIQELVCRKRIRSILEAAQAMLDQIHP